MRELKFRVWHKGRKSWLNDQAGTHLWSEYCLNIFTGELVEFITGDGVSYSRDGEPEFYFSGLDGIKESPYIIQQFTGLKDINGKDIYEGDILRNTKYTDITAFVRWANELEYAGWSLAQRYDDIGSLFIYKNMENLQIIGNILETPELLK